MANKLQELTDKLFQEGLEKGREEGERILAEAKTQAEQNVEGAKKEAEEIIRKARKEAEDLKQKTEADVRMASQQCLQATKKDIENLLINKISTEEIRRELSDSSMLKEIIRTVANNFSASESKDMSLVLPASLQSELEPWIKSELSKTLNGSIKAEFSKKIAGGFTIGPAEGGWFVSLTDDTFSKLIAEYLRPVTRKLLFGE
ncbi:MAG: hypothetical protein MJY89_03655 [Bacteroidales bacterium]|nr:hypothetical protein [Bacteroidales bacterium]